MLNPLVILLLGADRIRRMGTNGTPEGSSGYEQCEVALHIRDHADVETPFE